MITKRGRKRERDVSRSLISRTLRPAPSKDSRLNIRNAEIRKRKRPIGTKGKIEFFITKEKKNSACFCREENLPPKKGDASYAKTYARLVVVQISLE
jgi:hypothetical protein